MYYPCHIELTYGWETATDPATGRMVYMKTATGQTQWSTPPLGGWEEVTDPVTHPAHLYHHHFMMQLLNNFYIHPSHTFL